MNPLLKEDIQQIKKLIEKAKIKEAIQQLLNFETSFDIELRLQLSRISAIRNQELRGIADSANSTREMNQITYALLEIINDLEKEEHTATETPPTAPRTWVYKTRKQQMYLLQSLQGLECHKEDVRANEAGHQWTIGKQQAKEILEKDQISINPNYTERSGTYSLGPRKSWLYSKKLFPDPVYFKSLLKELLKKVST